jgi:hypothetical protein
MTPTPRRCDSATGSVHRRWAGPGRPPILAHQRSNHPGTVIYTINRFFLLYLSYFEKIRSNFKFNSHCYKLDFFCIGVVLVWSWCGPCIKIPKIVLTKTSWTLSESNNVSLVHCAMCDMSIVSIAKNSVTNFFSKTYIYEYSTVPISANMYIKWKKS